MKFVGRSTFEDVKASIRDNLTSEAMSSFVNQLVADPGFVTIKNKSVYDAIEIK